MRGELDRTWLNRIEIVGGNPAVDFVNTVHSRVEPEARDYLETPAQLIGWCRHVGLIDDAEVRALVGLAPARGEKLLDEARTLREMLYTLLSGYVHGRSETTALAAFNRESKRLASWRELMPDEVRFAWHYRIVPDHPRSLLAPIVLPRRNYCIRRNWHDSKPARLPKAAAGCFSTVRATAAAPGAT